MLCLAVGTTALLAACAPQANPNPGQVTGEGGGEAPAMEQTGWWSPESDCAKCHESSASTLASLACEAAQGDNACMTCHDDVDNIKLAHEKVSMSDMAGDDTYLKKSRIQMDTCLSCHNLDDLIAATADVDALTDFKGTTVNPHEAWTARNVNGAHDEITCGSCHKMHTTDGVTTEKAAYDFCKECHHTGEYICNTCH